MSTQKQIAELQSLRGIAAVVVLLHHASFAFRSSPTAHYAYEAVLNAHAAVMLFFVLSGYVLALSLLRSGATLQTTLVFYNRRLFRIYPAALVASLFGLLVRLASPDSSAAVLSDWFHAEVRNNPLGVYDLIQCFFTMKAEIIPPLWSIRVELVCSALIPLLVWASKKGYAVPVSAFLTALVLIGLIPGQLLYLGSFSLGVMLTRFTDWFARMTYRRALLIAAFIVLAFGRLINPEWRFEIGYGAVIPIVFESIAAMVLIGCIAAGGLSALRIRPLVWLGDISYSIYIWHFPIMISFAFAFAGIAEKTSALATFILLISTLATTLLISHVSYRLLEVPGIKLGGIVQRAMHRQFLT